LAEAASLDLVACLGIGQSFLDRICVVLRRFNPFPFDAGWRCRGGRLQISSAGGLIPAIVVAVDAVAGRAAN
jgi:hypothetical protein